MPYSDIEAKAIQELCKVIDCEHKTAPYVEHSEFLVVRTSNVRNGQLVMDDMKYTTQAGYNEWTQRSVPEYGDVLFTREAPAGESCLVPTGKKVCMGQRMVMLRPNKKKVDPVYLSLILATEKCKSNISRLSIGSTVSRINIADIKKLRVATPPLPEQRKIAQILSTWDKAISTTEQLLANSQQQKKALMQQLLTGKKRLLDNNGIKSRVSKTPYATLPSDWGETAMEEVSSFITKGATPTTYGFDWQDAGIPFLRSECVGEDGFKESGLAFICDEAHEVMKRSKVFTGDLLITITGNVGRVCKLPGHICEANINQHIAKITLNPQQVNTDFIYHCLQDIKYRKSFERITTGQAYPQISLVQVRDVIIPLPSIDEQEKISTVLTSADKEIEALQRELNALKQEKKALMQQLLTGKRRVF
ncbi:restriction endonuclease subunit S [Aeromonas veronii]|uniref:restriction endonuclease subunit S n=1 Tax=Aeromonas TaxID=642 RepID=UPI001F1E8E32|nr:MULTISPECIES: restriction endonuclease subunit S [Aeromonas]MCF5864303.1 restriction endonuclease subunit S [Aeromonas veronii]